MFGFGQNKKLAPSNPEQGNVTKTTRKMNDIKEEELRQFRDLLIQGKNMIEIRKYCDLFKKRIKGVTDVDMEIALLENLINSKQLNVKHLDTGKEIVLDCLNCEIKILDLGNEINKTNSYNIKKRNSSFNPTINYYETDEKGMEKISEKKDLILQGWKVASQTDIQNILKALAGRYSLVTGKKGSIHDEDIAFFMLITQSDGEFLLKKDKPNGENRVLKAYHDFRGFKGVKAPQTGQIILVRKK